MTTPNVLSDDAQRPLADLERLIRLPLRRKPRILSRWVPAIALGAIVFGIGWTVITAPALSWPIVGEYLFNPASSVESSSRSCSPC